MKRMFLLLTLLVPALALGQNNETCYATVAQFLAGECGGQPGAQAWVIDASSSTDCSAGNGTATHYCVMQPDGTGQVLGGGGGGAPNDPYLENSPAAGTDYLNSEWVTCSIDDCPGVLNGAGADPNPFPGGPTARESAVRTKVRGGIGTNALNWIHYLSSFNILGPAKEKSDLYSHALFIENSYDQGQRSGAELVEWNWDVSPATHVITITSGGGTGPQMGENIVFSDGANCRPAYNYTTNIRATCVAYDPPAIGQTISSGCIGCTGTWTVTNVVADQGYRAFGITWESANNRTLFSFASRNAQRVFNYDGFTLDFGVEPSTITPTAWFRIPAADTSAFIPNQKGQIHVDTSNAATPYAGQFQYHDGGGLRALRPWGNPICRDYGGAYPDPALTAADTQFRLSLPVSSEVAAVGCKNRTDNAGAIGTAATVGFRDSDAGAIALGATLTCSSNEFTTDMTWRNVSGASANRLLDPGEEPLVRMTNTPTNPAAVLTVCMAMSAQPQ